MTTESGSHVVLVDGDCVLCHGMVSWLLRIDKKKGLRFSTLQGETARRLLGGTPEGTVMLQDLDTVIYVRGYEGPERRICTGSTAALLILRDIGGFWKWVSWLTVIPRPLRDVVYEVVARYRYRWFGKHEDACPLPGKGERERILD